VAVVTAGLWARAATGETSPEQARVNLVYTRDVPGPATTCPEEADLRSVVAARLGYDPFVGRGDRVEIPRMPVDGPKGTRTVILRVMRQGAAVRGHFEMREVSGREAGARDIVSGSGDCHEVVLALAVTVAIGIDPLSATRSPRAAPPPAPPALPAAVATPPPSAPFAHAPAVPPAPLVAVTVDKQEAPLPWYVRAGTGAVVAVGATPSVDAGLTLDAGARRGAFSLSFEGRADFPVSKQAGDGGSVGASLALGCAVACGHLRIVRACVVAGVGALRAAGSGVTDPQQDTKPYVTLGGRLGVEVPVGGPLFVDVHGDALFAATRITFRLDGRDVWTTPPIGGVLGAGMGATFH
jgi:hypothetical protein